MRDGKVIERVFAEQDSATLSSFAASNILIAREPDCSPAAADEPSLARRLGLWVALAALVGVLLLPIAALAWIWPRSIAVPIAVIATWLGITLLLRAWKLRRERTK